MPRSVNPVRIEDVQATSKSPSVVVRVKEGFEDTAAAMAKLSGADSVRFQIGEDNLYLAGRGLDLKGLRKGTSVQYKGEAGRVSEKPLNQINTFREGANRPAAKVGILSTTAIGAGAGIIGGSIAAAGSLFLPALGAIPWTPLVLAGAGIGFAVGSGLALLSGATAASKRVDLKGFVTVAK